MFKLWVFSLPDHINNFDMSFASVSTDDIVYVRSNINGVWCWLLLPQVLREKDKQYNKTIIDYWGIGYDVNISNLISILTSAIASANIPFLWWISHHIQYLNSQ